MPPESAAHAVELPVSKLRSVAIGTSMTTYRKQGRAQDFSVGAKIEGPKAECEEVVLGKGQQPPHLQLRGLGELCELPSGVRGGAPIAQRFSTIFSTEDGLS